MEDVLEPFLYYIVPDLQEKETSQVLYFDYALDTWSSTPRVFKVTGVRYKFCGWVRDIKYEAFSLEEWETMKEKGEVKEEEEAIVSKGTRMYRIVEKTNI